MSCVFIINIKSVIFFTQEENQCALSGITFPFPLQTLYFYWVKACKELLSHKMVITNKIFFFQNCIHQFLFLKVWLGKTNFSL